MDIDYNFSVLLYLPAKSGPIPLKIKTMQELIEKIAAEMATFQTDANLQAEKGNKAAGTRARKSALELTKLLKEFRKVSMEEAKK